MSFPIFYPHRPLTLNEVYRYIKFFPQHMVYLRAFHGQTTDTHIPVETTHTFATHGLVLTLFWKGNAPYDTRSCHLPSKELFRLHKQGKLSLCRYEITEYSKPNSMQAGVPTEECRHIFYERIMQGTPTPSLTEQQYHQLEFSCYQLDAIPPTFYEQFIEEQNRKIAFNAYYEEYKKRKRNPPDGLSSDDKDKSDAPLK